MRLIKGVIALAAVMLCACACFLTLVALPRAWPTPRAVVPPTLLPTVPVSHAPVITINVSTTELKVNDMVIIDASAGGMFAGTFGNPLYDIYFSDDGAFLSVPESSILKRVPSKDDSGMNHQIAYGFRGTYQAVRAGSTRVSVNVNAEVCVKSVPNGNGGWYDTYDTPGCSFEYRNLSSEPVIITVKE